jgi:hypothetical protein
MRGETRLNANRQANIDKANAAEARFGQTISDPLKLSLTGKSIKSGVSYHRQTGGKSGEWMASRSHFEKKEKAGGLGKRFSRYNAISH